VGAGLAGKIVLTGDKLRRACDIEGDGQENNREVEVKTASFNKQKTGILWF